MIFSDAESKGSYDWWRKIPQRRVQRPHETEMWTLEEESFRSRYDNVRISDPFPH